MHAKVPLDSGGALGLRIYICAMIIITEQHVCIKQYMMYLAQVNAQHSYTIHRYTSVYIEYCSFGCHVNAHRFFEASITQQLIHSIFMIRQLEALSVLACPAAKKSSNPILTCREVAGLIQCWSFSCYFGGVERSHTLGKVGSDTQENATTDTL